MSAQVLSAMSMVSILPAHGVCPSVLLPEAGLSFALRIGGVGLPWDEGNADPEPPPAPLFQRGRCCCWAQENAIQCKNLVSSNVGTGQVTQASLSPRAASF